MTSRLPRGWRQRSIVASTKRWLAKEHGLQKTETIGEVAFITRGISVPVGPVDALPASIPYAVLEREQLAGSLMTLLPRMPAGALNGRV